jgi:hypothetical protein
MEKLPLRFSHCVFWLSKGMLKLSLIWASCMAVAMVCSKISAKRSGGIELRPGRGILSLKMLSVTIIERVPVKPK